MLIHHFTILQHKHLFVSEECEVFWVPEGLNPSEAYDLCLIPVIVLTLNVQGLGIYHQRFFKHDDRISIDNFLYEAWTESPLLQGVPDHLCVDQELLRDVPLLEILKQLDPEGKIKKVLTNAGRTFGSSKAQAHRKSIFYWNDFEGETKPKSIDALLQLVSDNIYKRQVTFITYLPRTRSKELLLEQHWALTPSLPSQPSTPGAYRLDTDWVTKASSQIPTPAKGLEYVYNGEYEDQQGNEEQRWVHWLHLKYQDTNSEHPDYEEFDDYEEYGEPSHYWSKDAEGLVSTINTLAYDIDEHLPNRLSPEQLQSFIKGREALSKFRIKDLEDLITSLPIIIFPKTIKECRTAFEQISRGGDCNYMFELVNSDGDQSDHPYRIFVCDGCAAGLFLIAVRADGKANGPKLKNAFFCIEEDLDIGYAGFSALSYWVSKVSEVKKAGICSLVLDMVVKMLRGPMQGRPTRFY